jgi:hypothetical protein
MSVPIPDDPLGLKVEQIAEALKISLEEVEAIAPTY